jgi:hypothetical protein
MPHIGQALPSGPLICGCIGQILRGAAANAGDPNANTVIGIDTHKNRHSIMKTRIINPSSFGKKPVRRRID